MESTRANREAYDAIKSEEYLLAAPHLRHQSIRVLYSRLVERALETATSGAVVPLILDLGAGDGSITREFLRIGATVVAVDVSQRQLDRLRNRCGGLGGTLEVRCADIHTVLDEGGIYDIIVANSLLHHIPDYVELLRRVCKCLSVSGAFLSFQDPMWKASLSGRDRVLSSVAYTVWRLAQGDVLRGVGRRLRRMSGLYLKDSIEDNTEYHAVRNGVDQEAVRKVFVDAGYDCEIVEYCSFHSDALQPLGERFGVINTFAAMATNRAATQRVVDSES